VLIGLSKYSFHNSNASEVGALVLLEAINFVVNQVMTYVIFE